MSAVTDKSEEENQELEMLKTELVNIRKFIVESETSYLALFNHTADTKAQNKVILWYILNLSFYKDSSKKHEDFVPFFEGDTFEEKEQTLFDLEENEDELYNEVYSKLTSIVSLWYFSGKIDKESFDRLLEEDGKK